MFAQFWFGFLRGLSTSTGIFLENILQVTPGSRKFSEILVLLATFPWESSSGSSYAGKLWYQL